MIILITGSSHAGKTYLAQQLLEKYKYPYLSIDHLKMGLIRSNNTHLTPLSSTEELTALLWPIVSEMIKTAIENNQNLIVEGCYIPFDWDKYFSSDYIRYIKYICLVMSENYIRKNYADIINYANVVEQRLCDDCSIDELITDNIKIKKSATEHNKSYILIDDKSSSIINIAKDIENIII